MAIITINEVDKTTKLSRVDPMMPVISIIGPATKGPLNTPTELTGIKDLHDLFGEDLPANYPYACIVAEKYLKQNGGVLFTRIANAQATAASKEFSSTIAVTARYTGTYGNNLAVSVNSFTSGSSTIYSVNVYRGSNENSATVIESFNFRVADLIADGSVGSNHIIITPDESLTGETVIPTIEFTPLTNGNNGDNFFPAAIDEVQQTQLNDFIRSINEITSKLIDPMIYEFAIICVPGINGIPGKESTDFSTSSNGVTLLDQLNYVTNTRKDCVAIIDPPKTSTYSSILDDLSISMEANPTNLAIFYPWYYGSISQLNTSILCPPSMFYLNACATSFKINKPWNAVAGPLSGVCDNVVSTAVLVGATQSRLLNENLINPIGYSRAYGYYLDGNNIYNPVATTRTYSQLSIRHAINYTKRELNKICQAMSYKQNSSLVRAEVLGRVSSLLEGLKTGEAIYGYRAYINESAVDLAEGIIRLTVKIFPTPALEEFVFDFEIVNVESAL